MAQFEVRGAVFKRVDLDIGRCPMAATPEGAELQAAAVDVLPDVVYHVVVTSRDKNKGVYQIL